jgi:hypothetical protein
MDLRQSFGSLSGFSHQVCARSASVGDWPAMQRLSAMRYVLMIIVINGCQTGAPLRADEA